MIFMNVMYVDVGYMAKLSCVYPFTLYPFWTRVRVKGNPYPIITW